MARSDSSTTYAWGVRRAPSPTGLPSSENLRLVECFTRVGPETLEYELTVEDPTTWTRPWTVMIPLKKSEDAIYEYACHEGNYSMESMLGGARRQEAGLLFSPPGGESTR